MHSRGLNPLKGGPNIKNVFFLGWSQMFLMMFPKFSMCFPRVFSITPHVYPMHFAQSSTLLTYIGGGAIGVTLHFHIEISIWGTSKCAVDYLFYFVLVFVVVGQMKIAHCQKYF